MYFGGPIQEQIEIASWHPFWTGGYTSADFGLDEPDEAIPYITVARTININADRIGVVMINIRETEFYRDIWQSQQDTIGTGLVIDNAGTVIAAPQNDFLGVPYGGGILPQECGNAIVGDRQINCLRIEDEPGMDWALVYEISLDSLYQNTYTLRDFFIVTSVVALLLGLLIAMYLFYRISKPLDQLQIAMKKMQEYDIGIKLEQRSRTELGQLGAQFDEMSNSIERMVGQIQTMEQEKCYLEERVLQSQINPHFLYNTLDSVVWMTENGRTEDAVVMLTALARFFRISLSRGSNIIPIADELEHARHYLTIQKMRYKNKFSASIEAEDGVEALYTIKLIVQPILENAIYHGMAYADGDGKITVHAFREGGDVVIDVTDNGPGMPAGTVARLLDPAYTAAPRPKGSGLGLRNVHQRIRLTFGGGYGLSIHSEPDAGTRVRVRLPALDGAAAAPYRKEVAP